MVLPKAGPRNELASSNSLHPPTIWTSQPATILGCLSQKMPSQTVLEPTTRRGCESAAEAAIQRPRYRSSCSPGLGNHRRGLGPLSGTTEPSLLKKVTIGNAGIAI